MIRAKWIRFTEETNALDFLEKAARFIRETEQDRIAWKWVVICLHGALYGFAIAACRGTSNDNIIEKKKTREELISFDKALEKCQDENWMCMLTGSQPLVLTESQKDSINILKKELRNNFEHFVPRGWSIEIHGLPQITLDILDVIRFLATETHTYIHLNQSQIKKVKSLVFQSKKIIKKSILYKELILATKV